MQPILILPLAKETELTNIIKQLTIFWICLAFIAFWLTQFGLINGAIELNPVAAWLINLGDIPNFVITFGMIFLIVRSFRYLFKLFPKAGLAAISILCLGSLVGIINNVVVLVTLYR